MENVERKITLLEVWDLVWSHKWWYVLSVFIFLCAGGIYLYRTPNQYYRYAKVLIDESDQDATLSSLGVATAGMMRLRNYNSVENEIQAFSSPDLMETVVQRLGLQTKYTEHQFFRDVELYGNSPFEVRFTGNNPHSDFSFKVTDAGEGNFCISDFRLGRDEFEDEIIGVYEDTLQTPVGDLVVFAARPDAKIPRPITVDWSSSISTAKSYCEKMNINLSGKESTVLMISIDDSYPSRAEAIITSLIDVYNEVWIAGRNRAAINTAEFINERLVVIEKDLGVVEEALKQYKSANNLTDIKAVAQNYLTESSEYASKAFEVNNQLTIARYIKEYMDNPANNLTLIPSNLGLTSVSVESQIKEYNDLVLQRDRLMTGSGGSNPVIADLNSALNSIRTAILRSVDNLIATLELQLAKIQSQEKQIMDRISSSSGQELQLLSIERQQQITQSLYMFLLQKREENELSALINVGNTRVIVKPDGPSDPVYPNVVMILSAMLIIGCAVPFAFFFGKWLLDTSIKNKSDLGNLSVPFLAEIPKMDKDSYQRSECRIIVEHGNRDAMNEAFRVLRTNIDLMLGRNKESKVIMFTSFSPSAGKTFTIMNVAASMALKNSRVILLDLDLRKATLSRILDKPHKGVSAYLNGQIDDYHQYVDEYMPGLYVLPVGNLPPNPTELLLSNRFTQLIGQLHREYDYIFLDCPPIDLVADVSIITEKADMTVFVLRSGKIDKSSIPVIEELYRTGKYAHMAILINGVDEFKRNYGYGRPTYGYGYGNHLE